MAERLDLQQRRDLGALLSTAFELYRSHGGIFLTLALIVVAPISFVVDGLWIGLLGDVDADPPVAALAVSALLQGLIVPALVTAMHVRVVQALGRGEEPRLDRALRDGLAVFAPVLGAVVIYTLVTIVGFALLILPGVYVGVLFFFAAQAVVVDDRRGLDALKRSRELVKGAWWPTFAYLIVLNVIAALLTLPFSVVAELTDEPWLYLTVTIVGAALALSYIALAGTLFFFSRRAERDLPWQGEPSAPLSEAPERPV